MYINCNNGPFSLAVLSYTTQVAEGEAPGVVVRMAQELDYSPAMLAKLVLEHHLKATCPDINSGCCVVLLLVLRVLMDFVMVVFFFFFFFFFFKGKVKEGLSFFWVFIWS